VPQSFSKSLGSPDPNLAVSHLEVLQGHVVFQSPSQGEGAKVTDGIVRHIKVPVASDSSVVASHHTQAPEREKTHSTVVLSAMTRASSWQALGDTLFHDTSKCFRQIVLSMTDATANDPPTLWQQQTRGLERSLTSGTSHRPNAPKLVVAHVEISHRFVGAQRCSKALRVRISQTTLAQLQHLQVVGLVNSPG